jgi:serine/threonine protein phosphatase PrpC
MENSTLNLEIAWTQHRGRDPLQQDALWNGAKVFQHGKLPVDQRVVAAGRQVFAIADGVASSPVPQRASRLVLELLAAEVADGARFDVRLIRRLHGGLCDALAKGKTFGTSTTLVAVECLEDCCAVLNVGDSRAYRIAASGEWQQISHDHSLINAYIARGEADANQEYASLYDSLDSCLVADDEEMDFDVHRAEAPFLPGDRLLLCSDGVHDTLGDERLKKLADPGLTLRQQVEVWRKAVLLAGAPDNFSMLLAQR